MEHIYLPIDNVNEYSCYTVHDKDTIRVFYDEPHLGTNAYIDFYINDHYLENEGTYFIDENTIMPSCFNVSRVTNNYYYRNDICSILFLVICILFCGIYLPYRLMSRFWKRLR